MHANNRVPRSRLIFVHDELPGPSPSLSCHRQEVCSLLTTHHHSLAEFGSLRASEEATLSLLIQKSSVTALMRIPPLMTLARVCSAQKFPFSPLALSLAHFSSLIFQLISEHTYSQMCSPHSQCRARQMEIWSERARRCPTLHADQSRGGPLPGSSPW